MLELLSFDCKLQRKKKHKTKKKKKEKKHEHALSVNSELSKFTLSVSVSDEATYRENAKQIYQIIALLQANLLTLHNYEEWRFHMTWSLISQGLWHVVRGQKCSDITLEKDDIVFRSIMYTIDDSLRSKILPSSFLSAKELWDYLRLQFAQSHDLAYDHVQQGFQAESVDKCEVLPIFTFPVIDLHDEFFLSFGELWEDVVPLPNPERAIKEYTECCFDLEMVNLQQEGTSHSIFFDLDLQHEMLDNICVLENNEIIDQFRGEDQSEADSQGVMETQEELALEFPWVEIDVQAHEFSSKFFQVSHHFLDLPVYINLNIPFGCPHDGSMETNTCLNDFLAWMSYIDIKGTCRLLTVTYHCLHLRNQVLVALELFESSNLIPSHGLAAKSPHFFQGQFQMPEQTLISEVSKGTGGAHAGAMHDCSKFSYAKILREQFQFFEFKRSSKGMHFSVVSQDKCREWYRGRKIWFRTNISWQSWLFFWLNLLHMLNSSTGILSLQQCSSSGGVLDLYIC